MIRSRLISPNLLLIVFLFISSTNGSKFSEWLNGILPHKGNTLEDELKCYSLPYGGIGFLSHILTYWTVGMLSFGRSPILLGKNKHWKFDLCLASIGLIGSFILSVFTIVRCRSRWDFVLLGIWKASMSLTLGLVSSHSALIVRRHRTLASETNSTASNNVLLWLIIYVPGFLIGAVGLGSLIAGSWSVWMGKKSVTIVTSFLLALTITVGLIASGIGNQRAERISLGYTPVRTAPIVRIPPENLFKSTPYGQVPRSEDLESEDVTSPSPTQSLKLPANLSRIPLDNLSQPIQYEHVPGSEDIELVDVISPHSVPSRAFQYDEEAIPDTASQPVTVEEPDQHQKSPSVIEAANDRIEALTPDVQLGSIKEQEAGEQPHLQGEDKPREDAPPTRIIGLTKALEPFRDTFALGPVASIGMVGILFALYSDFAIGAIAGNMAGVPSSDNAVLYWGYFIIKRLPILSV
jgi:hypothetical protein